MNCREFWEEWADGFGVQEELPEGMQDHLRQCSVCSREFSILEQGFRELKHEIEEEESAHFWHGLRQNVRANIKMPKRRFQWTLSFRNLGWAAAAGIVLILFIFKSSVFRDPSILEEDLLLLAGVDPVISVYDASSPRSGDEDDDAYDSDFYRGITDSWTSLMGQAVERTLLEQKNSYQPDHVRQDYGIHGNGMEFLSEIVKG